MAEMYPFDPTMTKASNRVVREQHVITSTNFRNYHYVIPHFAPFFTESVAVRLRLPDGQIRPMVEGRDFYFSHQFLDASATTNHLVNGSISFLDTDTEGVLEIDYHTIGGKWTLTPAQIIEILANNLRNPRITSWEFVANVPERFPVVDHPHDIVDFKTMSDVQQSIDAVRDAILSKSGGGLAGHISNFSNPHNVTKAQVGLGSVQNYSIATTLEAETGTSNAKYMTPLRTAEAIAAQAGTLLNSHTNRIDNPHQVTKAQVGLGSVLNYGIATQAEAEAGTSNAKYMTPLTVAQAIKVQVGDPLTFHGQRTDNPHQVTKSQIGLFNVENYLIATAQEARDGDRNDRYMTPLRTTQLVQQYVFGSLSGHTGDFTNPHNTTKAQVGLGSVENYPIATQVEATAGTRNDMYMTPLRTAEAIAFMANVPLNAHLNDLNNPHQVTKTHVGLGSVQNYAVASAAEAQAGTRTDRYMTPARTLDAITAQALTPLNVHIADYSNPHNTSKDQVGLGSVENYAPATRPEAQAGTRNDRYMTPLTTSDAITALALAPLGTHTGNTNNPHNTTKAQVGLGSVADYPVATVEEAQAGTRNDRYMTPALVRATVAAVSGEIGEHAVNYSNPHQVTKTQVGLGNVENYGIATQAEAVAGTSNVKYMTPYLVKQSMAAMQKSLSDHIADKNNPHAVSKADVGLSNVDNFATASDADMVAGTAKNKFVTPFGVKGMFDAMTGDIDDHAANRNNPHGVTASQVGAYTREEIDARYADFLKIGDTASDSSRFFGMTPDQFTGLVFDHDIAVEFRTGILTDAINASLPRIDRANQSVQTWYEIHSLTNHATTGGGVEKSDGFAIIAIGGPLTAAGKTTLVTLRTLSRITTGAGIRVQSLDGNGVDPGLKFGFTRSGGVIKSYVQVPANAGNVRVVEIGNIAASSTAIFTTSPSGFTEVAATDIVADLAATNGRVSALETSVSSISQILQGISIV